jgi:hypothetical protein
MRKREGVVGLCWVVIGIVVSIWSSTFPFGTWESVGPAVLPLGCGLLLVLLGSIFSFRVWKEHGGSIKEASAPLVPHGAAFRRVAISVGGMLVSAALIGFLGFSLTVFGLTLFLLRGVQPRRWAGDAFYALVFTGGCYVLFQVLFKTTLPKGFLGF